MRRLSLLSRGMNEFLIFLSLCGRSLSNLAMLKEWSVQLGLNTPKLLEIQNVAVALEFLVLREVREF